MTIPVERSRAIHNTREFLRALMDPQKTPKVPLSIRKQARSCLKHYPSDFDIVLAIEGKEVFKKMEKVLP